MKPRLLLALLVACASAAVLADDGAIEGVGGAIELLDEHPSVVMQKMDVTIDLYDSRGLVDCIFVFHNTGEAADVRMGFPESGGGVDVDPRNPHGFTHFATWVDGKQVATKIEGMDAGGHTSWRRWRTKTVHFDADQTRTVRVKYQPGIGAVSTGERSFQYEVHTGASWKGPIGLASVRLNLHYDPRRGRFTFSDRFQPKGPNRFEWIERDFEPTRADNVDVLYHPINYTVSLAGEFLSSLPQDGGHFRHGHFWLPVRWLESWLGADVSVDGPSATVISGRSFLDLTAGDPWIVQDGRRSPLPGPPVLEGSQMIVPFAAVLRALGAEVTYDPQTLTLDITPPIVPALGTGLSSSDARSAFRTLTSALPGWAPSVPNDRPPSDPPQPSWITFGDFNGDGRTDLALVLWKADEARLLVMEGTPASDFPFSYQWVSEAVRVGGTHPGTPPTEIRTRPPSAIRYSEPGETTLKSGRLHLQHDAVELTGERASLVYYWDAKSGRYKVIQTDE